MNCKHMHKDFPYNAICIDCLAKGFSDPDWIQAEKLNIIINEMKGGKNGKNRND